MIEFLTIEQVLRLHDTAIEKFGGLKGIRDANILASTIEMPKSCMFGEELHPTLYDKASAYLFHIIVNIRSTMGIKELELALLISF